MKYQNEMAILFSDLATEYTLFAIAEFTEQSSGACVCNVNSGSI